MLTLKIVKCMYLVWLFVRICFSLAPAAYFVVTLPDEEFIGKRFRAEILRMIMAIQKMRNARVSDTKTCSHSSKNNAEKNP